MGSENVRGLPRRVDGARGHGGWGVNSCHCSEVGIEKEELRLLDPTYSSNRITDWIILKLFCQLSVEWSGHQGELGGLSNLLRSHSSRKNCWTCSSCSNPSPNYLNLRRTAAATGPPRRLLTCYLLEQKPTKTFTNLFHTTSLLPALFFLGHLHDQT